MDFLETSAKLTDVFFDLLGDEAAPLWSVFKGRLRSSTSRDFDCPKPTAWDASAGCVAACGCLMLFELLRPVNAPRAEEYLRSGFRLISNILASCLTPKASMKDGVMNWGLEGWETVLCVRAMHTPVADTGADQVALFDCW